MTEPESAVSTEARLKYVQVDLSRATSPGKPGLMDDTADYAPAVRTCMGPASEPNMAKRRKGTQVLPSSSFMRLAFNDSGRGSNDGTVSPPSDASPSWPENTKENIVPSLTLVCPAGRAWPGPGGQTSRANALGFAVDCRCGHDTPLVSHDRLDQHWLCQDCRSPVETTRCNSCGQHNSEGHVGSKPSDRWTYA